MKKNKKWFTVLLILMIIFIWYKRMDNIMIELQEIKSNSNIIYFNNNVDNVKVEDEMFADIVSNQNIIKQIVNIGEIIKLKFKNALPDTIKIYDYILDSNGRYKYNDSTREEVKINIHNGIIEFPITQHFAYYFSSNSSDYEENAVYYRGYQIICENTNNYIEYYFVIKINTNTSFN